VLVAKGRQRPAAGQLSSNREHATEVISIDFDHPKLTEMLAGHLHIKQAAASCRERLHQPHQRHLRRIPLPREHRLARKHATEADSIQPANQSPLAANLHAVSDAGSKGGVVTLANLWSDPGPFGTVSTGTAAVDHAEKVGVSRDREPLLAERTGQPPWHM